MLTCLPQSPCSWNFRVPDAAAGPASVTFHFLSEQGSLTVGGREYTVHKHGPLSGRWTLEQGNTVCAEAHKPSAFFRSFEVSAGHMLLTLQAASALTRAYDLLVAGTMVGTIRPVHPFTRRARIECDTAVVPEVVQLFCFWLAVLTWRRAANENTSH